MKGNLGSYTQPAVTQGDRLASALELPLDASTKAAACRNLRAGLRGQRLAAHMGYGP